MQLPERARGFESHLLRHIIGMWLSLVEHYVRDVGAAGSNPVIPTTSRSRKSGLILSAFHFLNIYYMPGCSAAGSALDWGSRGRGFKSRHSDHVGTNVASFVPNFFVKNSALTGSVIPPLPQKVTFRIG